MRTSAVAVSDCRSTNLHFDFTLQLRIQEIQGYRFFKLSSLRRNAAIKVINPSDTHEFIIYHWGKGESELDNLLLFCLHQETDTHLMNSECWNHLWAICECGIYKMRHIYNRSMSKTIPCSYKDLKETSARKERKCQPVERCSGSDWITAAETSRSNRLNMSWIDHILAYLFVHIILWTSLLCTNLY